MEEAIKIINEMLREGTIKNYAIGGGIATILYTEPLLTYDLDIFFIPEKEEKGLMSLSPIYDFLKKRGYRHHQDKIIIGSMPVQFLPPYNELIREAVENAAEVTYKGIKTRAFRAEYLVAIMLQTFRPKDKERLIKMLDEAKINLNYLDKILTKHDLKEKFKQFVKKYYEE